MLLKEFLWRGAVIVAAVSAGAAAARAESPRGARSMPAAPSPVNGASAASPETAVEGAFAGNIRLDQSWGMAFATRQVPPNSTTSQAFSSIPQAAFYAFPAATAHSFGFAGEGSLVPNMDYLSPGDKLWLQAAYEKSAFGSPVSNAFATSFNPSGTAAFASLPDPFLMRPGLPAKLGCIFSGSAVCEQGGFEIGGSYKNSWLPILSSAIFGSYLEVHYQADTLAGLGGGAVMSPLKETRSDVNPAPAPRKGFDIGTEFMYTHLGQIRPPLPADAAITTNGLPAPQPDAMIYEGRLRLKRDF